MIHRNFRQFQFISQLVLVLAWLAVPPARADIAVTARESHLSLDWVYGFGGDTESGSHSQSQFDLVASDSFSHVFNAGNTGFYPPLNQGWTTDVHSEIVHEFSIQQFPTGVHSISASGSTLVEASAVGIGSAWMNSGNPGNQLILYFDVTDVRPFQISGSIGSSYVGAGDFGSAFVRLQYFDGLFWGFGGFYSEFLPNGGVGNWSASGTLNPGQYRLVSGSFSRAFGTESFLESFNYQFTSIPEPSCGLWAMGLAAIAAPRFRKRRGH